MFLVGKHTTFESFRGGSSDTAVKRFKLLKMKQIIKQTFV